MNSIKTEIQSLMHLYGIKEDTITGLTESQIVYPILEEAYLDDDPAYWFVQLESARKSRVIIH